MSFHEKLKNNSKGYWFFRELYVNFMIFLVRLKSVFSRRAKYRPRLLFYHLTGLGYGGTETFLQLLAKYANKDKYDVYYLYSDKILSASGMEDFSSRLELLRQGGVFPIRFDYDKIQIGLPYSIYGMSPDIFRIIDDFDIDLLVTAGSGHASFPFSAIRNIPIIFVNVFGQINLQKNIIAHLCISQEVANKILPFISKEKVKVAYVPSEEADPGAEQRGKELRRKLGIPDSDLVFGRIGRNSNDIFDPIGILAFQKAAAVHGNIHYLVISPPPILATLVMEEKIPNVHFVKGSGKMEDLWAFYYAMDILAHFRKDGESFGLNIAQAMLCGRPVISHKSRFWNAHLEYLSDNFSKVAEIDDFEQYARHMNWFIEQWKAGNLANLGKKAREKAVKLVSAQRHVKDFEEIIDKVLKQ